MNSETARAKIQVEKRQRLKPVAAEAVTTKPRTVDTVRKSELTRGRILDAAAYVFRRKGYALTRLSDIAKKAGTRTSSIYYYFESREAIVHEVLRIANEQTAAGVTDAIAILPPEATPRERITAAIHGHLRIVLSEEDYTRAHMRIFDQIPPKMREHFLRVLDQGAEVWRRLFEEARAAGEIEAGLDLSVVRLLLLGMMNWSIEWYRPGRLSIDAIADHAAALLFAGMSVPLPTAPAAAPSAPRARGRRST